MLINLIINRLIYYFTVFLGNKSHVPSQVLDIDGPTFESQVATVIKNVLEPLGYEVLKWTKLPYLCEGDLRQSYYWLDDVVFVLKVSDKKSYDLS